MSKIQRPFPIQEINPYKKTSFLDTNCFIKAVMVTIGGGAMGFMMALFMNAVEFREIDYGRTKMPTRAVLRKDFYRMLSMSRGFAFFGCFFSIFECQLEKMRHRDDEWNSFYAGGLTSVLVAAEALGFRGLLGTGFFGGMFGLIMYKVQMAFMH